MFYLKIYIKKILNKLYYVKGKYKYKIILIDDIMPSVLSPWRSNEYNDICREFENVMVLTNQSEYHKYDNGNSYYENIKLLSKDYYFLSKSIRPLNLFTNINTQLIYFVFYKNVSQYFDIIERKRLNFAFTLYPGGGFNINCKATEKRLTLICNSIYFKGLIVNQYHVKKYLINNNICEEKNINLIPGVPINLFNRVSYNIIKDTNKLKLLFFANKYCDHGMDKGFDTFIEVAKILSTKNLNIEFHVIGSFSKKDLHDEKQHYKIFFHGSLSENSYFKILAETHIILSPNRPFILNKFGFDGFPLSTCVDASLFSNLIMATDYFDEASSMNLINNIDFIKINNDEIKICQRIIELYNDAVLLKTIANNGKQKISKIYSYDNQLIPRLNFFKKIIQ